MQVKTDFDHAKLLYAILKLTYAFSFAHMHSKAGAKIKTPSNLELLKSSWFKKGAHPKISTRFCRLQVYGCGAHIGGTLNLVSPPPK